LPTIRPRQPGLQLGRRTDVQSLEIRGGDREAAHGRLLQSRQLLRDVADLARHPRGDHCRDEDDQSEQHDCDQDHAGHSPHAMALHKHHQRIEHHRQQDGHDDHQDRRPELDHADAKQQRQGDFQQRRERDAQVDGLGHAVTYCTTPAVPGAVALFSAAQI